MAIGFGLGAAFGAKVNNDRTPGTEARASLAFGAIGAMLGAVVGAGVPSFDARNRHRHGPWPPAEDEEDQLAARSEPRSAEPQGEQNEASKSARLSDPSPELTVP